MRRTSIMILVFLFIAILTQGAIIKLTDGSRAIVNVITATDKGALVQAEGMEPIFIDAPDIEWLAIDERFGSGGFGNGVFLTNGLRTYAKAFEITEKSGYIDSVHGMVLVGGINDIRTIDYTTFSKFPSAELIRKNTKYTQINATKASVRTAKTTDDNVFEFEKVQWQNDMYVFEIRTIKIMAKVSMIKEVNLFEKDFEKFPAFLRTSEGTTFRCSVSSYQGDTIIVQTPVFETLRIPLTDIKEFQKNFEETQALLPTGIVASFDSGSEIVLTKSPDFWLIGRLEKTPDGKLQLTNVVSNLQANKIKIQRKNFGMKWKFQTDSGIVSSPAIGSDGTIYVGSQDSSLYAITSDGKLKWKIQTGSGIVSSPAIGLDGTIYVGSQDSCLYAITSDGKLKWKIQTGSGIVSSPAIGLDGTIYVGSQDSYLYAITPDGKLKWRFQTGSQIYSSPAIGLDGTVYVGSQDSYLYAITSDGKLKWKFQTGGAVSSSPAIGSDGTIYVGSRDFNVYAITPDGKLKWKVYVDRYSYYDYKYNNSISSVVIGVDGNVYVAAYMGERNTYSDWYYYSYNLFAISTDGKIKWCLPISVGSSTYRHFYSEIISSPVIGLGNVIYITHSSMDGLGYLHIVTYDGKTNESLKLEKGTDSSLNIGQDGTIYVGSYDGCLYAIQTISPGLDSSSWSKFRGNFRNTGLFDGK